MPGKIRNFRKLAVTKQRQALLEIAEAGLEAIDTKNVVQSEITLEGDQLRVGKHTLSLKRAGGVYVFGAGKCALEAAEVLEEILGEKLTGGFVMDVRVPARHRLRRIKCAEGTHPLPSAANVQGSKRMVKELEKLGAEDIAILVISGGGSALLCLPAKGGSYESEIKIQKALSRQGATIEEVNTVRKHLSLVRGGYLAKYAHPARVVSLLFSDVPGDRLEFVASGPAIRDNTSIADAEKVLRRYRVGKIGAVNFIETPKENKYFKNAKNFILVSNERALRAMAEKARDLDYRTKIVTAGMAGEARSVALGIVDDLHRQRAGTVLLYGGETTVTVMVGGRGGRNRELVLAGLTAMKNNEGLVALASDGRDNGEHAGAIADAETIRRAARLKLDAGWYLDQNQSAKFFEKSGDYIMTGDTGSNVSDLVIGIKG
jgi:glycerate-2-kinase